MRHLFTLPLGACSAPFGFSRKESGIGAAALAAGIAATASTVNSAMNNYAADLTSDRQFYRTQDLMHLQKDIDMDKWREQIAYNTPKAEMQRYREAGLNPYLLSRDGLVGSGSSQSMPNGSAPSVPLGQTFPNDLSPIANNISNLLAVGSQTKSQRIQALSDLAKSAPELVKAVGPDAAKRILSSAFGTLVDTDKVNSFVDNQMTIQEAAKTQEVVKANIAKEYGMKQAENALAIQQQEYSKIVGELNLMHTEAEKNRSQIHNLAAQYCVSVARAYNLRKQGDIYSIQGYILDNIKEYNITLQRLALNRAMRQDYTESAFFEANRDLYNYLRNDPEAKDVQLENFKNNNDTFWNEVNVIMSSWQVKTNVGFSGSYGRKDTYGHGFGYDD